MCFGHKKNLNPNLKFYYLFTGSERTDEVYPPVTGYPETPGSWSRVSDKDLHNPVRVRGCDRLPDEDHCGRGVRGTRRKRTKGRL